MEKKSRLKLWLSITATCISIATGSVALMKACDEEPVVAAQPSQQPQQVQYGNRCCTYAGACWMVAPPQGPVGASCTCSTAYGMFQGVVCK